MNLSNKIAVLLSLTDVAVCFGNASEFANEIPTDRTLTTAELYKEYLAYQESFGKLDEDRKSWEPVHFWKQDGEKILCDLESVLSNERVQSYLEFLMADPRERGVFEDSESIEKELENSVYLAISELMKKENISMPQFDDFKKRISQSDFHFPAQYAGNLSSWLSREYNTLLVLCEWPM